MNMKKVVYPASPDTCGAVVGGTGARKKMTKEYRRERKVKGIRVIYLFVAPIETVLPNGVEKTAQLHRESCL